MPRIESPEFAPAQTHRFNLDLTYCPVGNEDKDHTSLFPLPPSGNIPTRADRIYIDPYDTDGRAKINENSEEFHFNEFERELRHPIKNTLSGNQSAYNSRHCNSFRT